MSYRRVKKGAKLGGWEKDAADSSRMASSSSIFSGERTAGRGSSKCGDGRRVRRGLEVVPGLRRADLEGEDE